jgi:hypothetical protein
MDNKGVDDAKILSDCINDTTLEGLTDNVVN